MKTMINIKADKEVKESAQRVAAELGLPLSTVINAYLKEFIRERSVRFSIEPQLRPEVEKMLKQASKDYKIGKNIVGPFDNVKDLMKSLESK
ncbi:MAG: type II toxin-antitoxin system RelB/DinJ family antitoxin [Patescibacteria group bacterium]